MTAGHPVVTQPCTVCHNQISFSGIKFDHTNAMPGTCASCHNGHAGIGQAVRPRSDDAVLRFLSQVDHPLGGCNVRPHVGSCRNLSDVPQRHERDGQACQPPRDLGVVRQLPSGHGMEEGEFQSRRSRGRNLRQLPQRNLGERHAADSRAGQRILRRLPHDVHLCRHRDESRRVRERLRGVPRHGQEFLRRQHQDAAAKPRSRRRDCVRDMSRLRELHDVLRHADEPQPVSGTACATCHETGRSYFGVTIVTRPTPAQDRIHPSTGDCGTCHTTSSFAVASVLPANHLPTAQACALCHTSLPSYKPGIMNHTGIGSGCTTCHAASAGGIAFVGVTPVPQGSGHIPTAADCATCHASTVKFGPGTAMNHAGDQRRLRDLPRERQEFRRCEDRHATDARTRSESSCHGRLRNMSHSTTSFARRDAGKPANHIPTSQACTLCHANPPSYKPGVMNHAGISSGCTTCHAVGSDRDGVLRRDAAAAGVGPHPDQC